MSRPVPERESLRRAIRWISDRRLAQETGEEPVRPLAVLVDEAARRFDLSPLDTEFLLDFHRGAAGGAGGGEEEPRG